MSDESKHLVVAPKSAALTALPEDWQDQLKDIAGVQVLGSAFGRMQVRATPHALNTARQKLGHVLNFEEIMPRGMPE